MMKDLYQIADELRAVANSGIHFSENGYDQERYRQVLKASARLIAALEQRQVEEVLAEYTGNLGHLSPLLGVEAVVIRQGKALLIRRRDDGRWAAPGGLAEVGESLAQAAVRELWEEAGVRGRAVKLLGVYDSRFWPTKTRMQLCIAQFLVESDDLPGVRLAAEEGLSAHTETLDAAFFDEQHLPELHVGHEQRLAMAFKLLRGEIEAPYFDR